jgi:MinD-like ATPase involved in chromosome partitioning or flagellar assembly
METDPVELGIAIDEAYERFLSISQTEKTFVNRVSSECRDLIGTVADSIKQRPTILISSWSEGTLERYFELAVVMLLASDQDESFVFSDLAYQLSSILQTQQYPQKKKAAAQALLESLILAIENVEAGTSHQTLELLAHLSNAPEGVIPPLEGPQFQAQGPSTAFDNEGRALLRDLLQVGLFREVMTFLRQREDLSGVRESAGTLSNIRKPIVSFASRKGGVGKSMLVFATAAWYLTEVRPGARVCIIDLDLSGPVWQYLLFPERGKPSHFLNDLFRLDQGNQKGEFEFPSISEDDVPSLLEQSTISVGTTPVSLLSFADLPRTSRYLSLAIANNSESCFRFLIQLLLAIQSSVDFVVIDNAPGFESLPLLSHVLATSAEHGCSIVVSTPSLPDLRGTLIELSDLYILDRESELVKRPPLWIVNKADSKAQEFLNTKHNIVDVASEIEAYNSIVPVRPLVGRAVSPSSDKFHGLALPLDQELLAFSNIKNMGKPPLQDALKTFLSTEFFDDFKKNVGPELLQSLTEDSRNDGMINAIV